MWQILVGPVAGLLDTVIRRVLPEKMSEAEKARLQQELLIEMQKLDWSVIESQLKINLEEAKHASRFVAGWRPFIGWVCGSGLAYHIIFQPLIAFSIAATKWQSPPLPEFDTGTLLTVLLGMLGLGGLRTYEKVKGVEANRS